MKVLKQNNGSNRQNSLPNCNIKWKRIIKAFQHDPRQMSIGWYCSVTGVLTAKFIFLAKTRLVWGLGYVLSYDCALSDLDLDTAYSTPCLLIQKKWLYAGNQSSWARM